MYQTEDGNTKINIRIEVETVWMTQKMIAELFQKSLKTINEHIKNIYRMGELAEFTTIRRNRIVQTEGERQVEREVSFYNLGVPSHKDKQFTYLNKHTKKENIR